MNPSNQKPGMPELLERIETGTVQAAIFDIDGTLIDSMPVWEDLDAEFLKTQGIELTEQEKRDLNETMWTMTVDEGIKHLKETFALSLSEEDIGKALSAIIEDFYVHEVLAKPGMPELVQTLHEAGIPMALATVGEPEHETGALNRLGLLDFFKAMFDCNSLGTTKRESKVYEVAAAALLNSEPPVNSASPADLSTVLVFEDVFHALEAAKKAGFTTVAVEDAASAKDREVILETADFYISQ